jgi:hypothetical protein
MLCRKVFAKTTPPIEKCNDFICDKLQPSLSQLILVRETLRVLLVTNGFHRIEPCGLERGINPKDQPD